PPAAPAAPPAAARAAAAPPAPAPARRLAAPQRPAAPAATARRAAAGRGRGGGTALYPCWASSVALLIIDFESTPPAPLARTPDSRRASGSRRVRARPRGGRSRPGPD